MTTIEDYRRAVKFLQTEDFSDLGKLEDAVKDVRNFSHVLSSVVSKNETKLRNSKFLEDFPSLKYLSGTIVNGYVKHAVVLNERLSNTISRRLEKGGNYDIYYGDVQILCKTGYSRAIYRRVLISRNEYDFTKIEQETKTGYDGKNYHKVCVDCLKIVTKELLEKEVTK